RQLDTYAVRQDRRAHCRLEPRRGGDWGVRAIVGLEQPACIGETHRQLLVACRPGDDQAIGWQSTVKRARRDAIHVFDVFGGGDAESVEVEMRIACDERIESPVDHVDAELADGRSLILLESAADA